MNNKSVDPEQNQYSTKISRKEILIIIFVCVCFLALLCLSPSIYNIFKYEETYQQAIKEMDAKNYQKAIVLFEKTKTPSYSYYRDAGSLKKEAEYQMEVSIADELIKNKKYKKALEHLMNANNTYLHTEEINNKIKNTQRLYDERKKEIIPQKNILIKQMKVKKDEIEDIIWYRDKTSASYINENAFFLYFGVKKGSPLMIRLKVQYTGEDWLFFNRITLNIDGKQEVINFNDYRDKKSDNDSKVYEWVDMPLDTSRLKNVLDEAADSSLTAEILSKEYEGKNYIPLIEKIIKSKKTLLRLEGDTYHYDREVTSNEKAAMKRVLDLYNLMNE